MKKLLILSECRESASIDESATSYAKRELGAEFAYFGSSWAAHVLADGKPDVVVYRSTLNRERMLNDETLRWIKSLARLVLWCSESSSWHYTNLLRHYKYENLFDLSIGTDGGSSELADWNTLWPVDPWWYREAPFDRRDINLGFGGSIGDDRKPLIRSFGDALTVRERKAGNSEEFDRYGSYAAWLMRCRAVVNDATLDGGYAVKNRVIEAGLAGCCLFEMYGSPLAKWGFVAGRDYLQFNPERIEDLTELVLTRDDFNEMAETFGSRLREKVRQFHPSLFWQRVLG